MTSADPGPGFSLTYELEPDDLKEVYVARPKRKRRRSYAMLNTVLWAVLVAALTAVTVALDLPSVVKDTSGTPGWLYVVDAVIWGLVAYGARLVWRLSPTRFARRARRIIRQRGGGRHHDEVGPGGVTCIEPDGTQVFTPWTGIDRIRETERAFHLFNHRDAMRALLPKRGLSSPDLIPALREFLNRSVDGQPPAAAADAAAGESKP